MQKLVYPVWADKALPQDAFRDLLVLQLGPELASRPGVHGVRITVVDSAVAAASGRRMQSHPPAPDAVLSIWVDSVGRVKDWEALIDSRVSHKSCYLVAEAEPLPGQQMHPSAPGERVYGMCQVVFFSRPAHLGKDAWLALWQGGHTQLAIDTQSTFGYRQNLVLESLSEDALEFDAIVEENFPDEAMSCDHAFYATGGDSELLQQRMSTMMESCARFIDFATIDVIPMSEYVIKPFARP